MTVNWTEVALSDLHGIESYIAKNSAQYARGMVKRIFAKADTLATQPMIGAVVPEYDDGELRELFEHPYRIAYRIVSGDRVDIVAVVHAARHMPRGL